MDAVTERLGENQDVGRHHTDGDQETECEGEAEIDLAGLGRCDQSRLHLWLGSKVGLDGNPISWLVDG